MELSGSMHHSPGMVELFDNLASVAALFLEMLVVLTVCAGAIDTVVGVARYLLNARSTGAGREVWMRFARWLTLALEFALGADIVRTAIAPTWEEIGQLAVIAAIRTGLGVFLERDMDSVREPVAR